MGITGLTKVIGDYAASAVKENEIKNYFGKPLQIDWAIKGTDAVYHSTCEPAQLPLAKSASPPLTGQIIV